ncbi:hypothetical protein IW261DRAFT_1655858 [Armillaria novae-zelandiae]|uniref:Uncharacterized protein n=1 Tax=Armillaria novae-zelandiae TaxID=153914 RepID=A0AA39U953_9AGAR|nr:hypothetical protein IW261DRAFT_1655858 [Armillaria novae-zelandiae]
MLQLRYLLLLVILSMYICKACDAEIANTSCAIGAHKSWCKGRSSRACRLAEMGLDGIKTWDGGTKRLQALDHLMGNPRVETTKRDMPGLSQLSPGTGDAMDIDKVIEAPLVHDIDLLHEDAESAQADTELDAEPTGCSRQTRMIPRRLFDYLPSTDATKMGHSNPLLHHNHHPPEAPALFTTEANDFGLFRQYHMAPSLDPDLSTTLSSLCYAPTFNVIANPVVQHNPLSMYGLHTVTDPSLLSPPSCTSDNNQWFTPFLNATVCHLMNWFFATMTKTLADLDALVNNVLLVPDFQMSDLTEFDATWEAKCLDNHCCSPSVF